MVLEITPLFTIFAAVIYLVLWMRVTMYRGTKGISIGDNGDMNLLQRVRQHGNCAEWSTFLLVLMLMAELKGATGAYLYPAGALFILGRLVHPFGLKIDNAGHPLRYVGNIANLLAAALLLSCLVYLTFFAV